MTLGDVSGDGLFRGISRKTLNELRLFYIVAAIQGILWKNSVFVHISAFFCGGNLSGYEKKLYLYRIWLEKLRKHFTNP